MKHVSTVLLIIGVLLALYTTYGQPSPDTLWTWSGRTGGGSPTFFDLQTSTDGGYGLTRGVVHRFGDQEYSYLKVDGHGALLGSAVFHTCPEQHDGPCTDWPIPGKMAPAPDGGFVMAEEYLGFTQTAGTLPDGYYGWAFRVRKFGGTGQWVRDYGAAHDSLSVRPEGAKDIKAVAAGGFIVAGYLTPPGTTQTDICIVRIDIDGNAQWSRTFGGSSADVATTVMECGDGGFILGGSAQSFGGNYLMKVNAQGDSLWMRQYDGISSIQAIDQTFHGGIIAACSGLYDLIETDSVGNLLWSRPRVFSLTTITQTNDGGYVASNSQMVIRYSAYGDTVWTRHYPYISIKDVHPAPDGGFAIAGTLSTGNYGVMLVKTGPETGMRVLIPNGGEDLRAFSADTVRWFGGGFEGFVRIELNRFYPSGFWELVADSVPNEFRAAVTLTGPPSTQCRLRVQAIRDDFSDVSDADFTISSPQGFLAMVSEAQPNQGISSWTKTVECPIHPLETFRLKNFGNDALHVMAIRPLSGTIFHMEPFCSLPLTLVPNQMSQCSLRLWFDPPSDGEFRDTLLLLTDAMNGIGGYVSIPFVGIQVSAPEAPQIIIHIQGHDARLAWHPVTQSNGGCQISAPEYLVFFSQAIGGPYLYHGYTTDTTYIHAGAMSHAPSLFYNVVASSAPLPVIQRLLSSRVQVTMTEDQVLDLLHQDGPDSKRFTKSSALK